MYTFIEKVRLHSMSTVKFVQSKTLALWRRYRALEKRKQMGIAALATILLLSSHAIIGFFFPAEHVASTLPSVTLSSISELAGNGGGGTILGNVRSMSEASILAQSGGTVTSIHTKLGSTVAAGAVLAELDNAAQRAAVLQAEGGYEAALAAQAGASPADVAQGAQNTYVSSYTTLDSTIKTYLASFFGDSGAQGPQYLVSATPFDPSYFPAKKAQLDADMTLWRSHIATAQSTDGQALLTEAERITGEAQALANDMALSATRNNTDVSSAQLASLSAARSAISSLQAGINAAKLANKSQSSSSTLGISATLKTALGTLRAAQAALEKTLVRAPIGGTVNFFPLHVGDYVTPLSHVATVAQNGALEIVSYISESTLESVAVGQKVTIEDKYQGVVTSIAPALDPVTKQVEVHVGVTGTNALTNGQSVRIALPGTSVSAASSSAPVLLPLTAVKLTPTARVVFSVGEDSRLVAHAVDIGDVRGERIEVLTELSPDLRIVEDARGLAEGQKVQAAVSTLE